MTFIDLNFDIFGLNIMLLVCGPPDPQFLFSIVGRAFGRDIHYLSHYGDIGEGAKGNGQKPF